MPANGSAMRERSRHKSGGEGGQVMSPQLALNALRRWWMIALPIGLLLGAAAVAVVYWQFQPQYEAVALLKITEQPQFIVFEPRDAGISRGYFRTQVEIIRSRMILDQALLQLKEDVRSKKIKDLPEIHKETDRIGWLQRRVSVVSPNESALLEIKYASPEPEAAAAVVNAITTQYLKEQQKEESAQSQRILDALKEQLSTQEENVRNFRKQAESLASKFSDKEPDSPQAESSGSSALKNPLAELQGQLINVQVDRAMLRAKIGALEEEIRGAEEAAATQKDTGAEGLRGAAGQQVQEGTDQGRNRAPRHVGGKGPGQRPRN